MCMKVNEGEWREMNVYELMQISIGQRVTALRLGAIPVFNAKTQKCSQVLRNFYFCLDSLFSLAIFGYLCIHFFPCEAKAAICNDWICFGYFCRLLCSTRFYVRQTGHVSRVTGDLLVRFCSSKCLQRQ